MSLGEIGVVVTVNVRAVVPLLPSVATASVTTSLGPASSFVMVPVPMLAPRSALKGADRVTVSVSSPSSRKSPATVTWICFVVSPAANTSVPFAAV